MTPAPCAAIYCRISRDSEQEGLGVARQEEDCRALAEREGLDVVGVHVDNDISASTKAKKSRPAYDALLAAVRAGQVLTVIAYSNSRLTRRPRELEDLIDLHAETGVLIKTVVSGDDDLSTADGRMVARIKANIDAAEAERTSERVTRAHLQLAISGAHNGPRPFGWDFNDDRTLRINPEEAAVVRECVDRVLAGEGIWKITRDLNARGVTTSTGRQWQTQVLRRMILRWRNCGIRTHLGKESGAGQWPALYDREIHERVVALLTDPARRSNNRGTEARYLGTSLFSCGECGGYVAGTNEFSYVLKSGRTRHYPHSYKCAHDGCMKVMRRMADVDVLVESVVLARLERDGVQLLGGDPAAARAAKERIEALEAKLALTADQYADDAITADQLRRITERLRPQLAEERTRLGKAQPDASVAEFTGPTVAAAWNKADVETRKRIIRLMGMRVTINRVGPGNGKGFDPDSVAITWAA